MLSNIIFFLSFILLTLPSFITVLFPKLSLFLNISKLAMCIVLVGLLLLKIRNKEIKVDKFFLLFIIYSLFLFFITFVNDINLSVAIKTYFLNLGGIILINLVLNKKNNSILKLIYYYNSILILSNFLLIIVDFAFLHNSFLSTYSEYILGFDNRFILYFVLHILIIIMLFSNDLNTLKKKMIFWYIIGILSLLFTWSAAALVVYTIMFILYLYLFHYKKKINIKFWIILVFCFSAAFVFFNIQTYASHFIENILHKTLSLSYRTDIWQTANKLIFKNNISFIFGYGFQDLTKILKITVYNRFGVSFILSPIHMHNLIENLMYDGGIVGTLIYIKMYFSIFTVKKEKITSTIIYNFLAVIIISMQALMIFDVFEFYPIYYMILAIISYSFRNDLKEVIN